MWLRFKIFVGYITLIALLTFTIYFFRKEQTKRIMLQQDEQELLHFWHLTAKPTPVCWILLLMERRSVCGTRTIGVLTRKGEMKYAAHYSP